MRSQGLLLPQLPLAALAALAGQTGAFGPLSDPLKTSMNVGLNEGELCRYWMAVLSECMDGYK